MKLEALNKSSDSTVTRRFDRVTPERIDGPTLRIAAGCNRRSRTDSQTGIPVRLIAPHPHEPRAMYCTISRRESPPEPHSGTNAPTAQLVARSTNSVAQPRSLSEAPDQRARVGDSTWSQWGVAHRVGQGLSQGTPSYWQQGQGQPITYGSTIMPGMWTFDGTFSPQVRWDPDQAGRGREPRFKHPASTVVGRQCQRVALDTLQAENGNLPRCTPMGLNTLRTAWSVTL